MVNRWISTAGRRWVAAWWQLRLFVSFTFWKLVAVGVIPPIIFTVMLVFPNDVSPQCLWVPVYNVPGPTASALERTVSSVLSQSHCLLFLTHRMTEQQSAFPLPILKPWAQLLLHPPKRWVAVFRSSPASYTVLKLLLICWGLNTPWQISVEIHSWFLSAMSVLRKCPSLVN